jgi:hypothetical protein
MTTAPRTVVCSLPDRRRGRRVSSLRQAASAAASPPVPRGYDGVQGTVAITFAGDAGSVLADALVREETPA